jgi:cobalt-zinc-cadmium resistance protein CzcA
MMAAKERLPEGLDPAMAPVAPGGRSYQHYRRAGGGTTDPAIAEAELTDQRTFQDWVLRPLLKSVPGVIDVNAMGGFVKQYQIVVDPAKLRKYDLTLHDIYDAVAKNNANAGGNILERHAERAIVRGLGLIKTTQDIESIIVKEAGGTPVFVRDVADVRIGHAVRHGAVVLNGEREIVTGTVLMIRGGNARQVVEAVKAKVDDLQQNRLPRA